MVPVMLHRIYFCYADPRVLRVSQEYRFDGRLGLLRERNCITLRCFALS